MCKYNYLNYINIFPDLLCSIFVNDGPCKFICQQNAWILELQQLKQLIWSIYPSTFFTQIVNLKTNCMCRGNFSMFLWKSLPLIPSDGLYMARNDQSTTSEFPSGHQTISGRRKMQGRTEDQTRYLPHYKWMLYN